MTDVSPSLLAKKLQARKRKLLTVLRLPPEGLAGSLSQSHYRCGKSNCHCVEGEGHARWSLTFMVEGKKRVQNIPKEWAEFVRERVDEGRSFKEGVAELMAINAQLFALERKQARGAKARPGRPSVERNRQ